MLFTGMIDLM